MEGAFLFKTICVKTNNKNISGYLLNELEYFDFQDIYVSCYDFRFYTNVIIHYVGKDMDLFLNKISMLLSYAVVDFYEPALIKNLLNTNYFYFSTEEKKQIYDLCLTNIDFSSSISMLNIISSAFHKYFSDNKYVILDGFVNFMLKDYIYELDCVVDMCVNKFIVDREYNEFISLLKVYIQTTPSNCDAIHLIYKDKESILLDSSKNVISFNKDLMSQRFLSDISFSSNDFALNSLLTLLPKKLFVHLLDKEDDFINTLKLVFAEKVFICTDCNLCNLYKSRKLKKTTTHTTQQNF